VETGQDISFQLSSHGGAAPQHPGERAECRAIPTNTKFTDMPPDCRRLLEPTLEFEEWPGWESQMPQHVSLLHALVELAPLIVIPPLLLLALGSALFWALAGFNPRR
jgi:hypothetical protein